MEKNLPCEAVNFQIGCRKSGFIRSF